MSQSLTFLLYYNQGYGSEDSSGKTHTHTHKQKSLTPWSSVWHYYFENELSEC